jgi:type II secretory pathway predicted ATPase ExeA
MTAKWLSHFNLESAPFSKEIDVEGLWLSPTRQSLVDELVSACHERGHVLLTGEPGVGKTCVLRALRAKLPEAGFRLTYCHNATLGRRDFYRQLCLAMGLSPKATAAAVFYEVTQHVERLTHERMHPVFLLDEAHLLHQDVLDHLHILANYQWDSKALLSIVLVGLPELQSRLQLLKNRSLLSRIHTRLSLDETGPEATAAYIEQRMKQAGGSQTAFTSDALVLIHQATEGRLREIDRVATESLKDAARKGVRRVDPDIVEYVVS